MKSKIFLSSLALLLFAFLGGGSVDPEGVWAVFVFLCVIVVIVVIVAIITAIVQSHNKKKRLQMIKEDEEKSPDFDRSVFIGDDRLKIYFDSNKKQVMLMRVTTESIKKEYVDNFEFPGNDLAKYSNPAFYIYDPVKRRMLSGSYTDDIISHKITSIAEQDNNKNVSINNNIQPRFSSLGNLLLASSGINEKVYHVLIEENRGLIAICESGKVGKIFNYITPIAFLKRKAKNPQ